MPGSALRALGDTQAERRRQILVALEQAQARHDSGRGGMPPPSPPVHAPLTWEGMAHMKHVPPDGASAKPNQVFSYADATTATSLN